MVPIAVAPHRVEWAEPDSSVVARGPSISSWRGCTGYRLRFSHRKRSGVAIAAGLGADVMLLRRAAHGLIFTLLGTRDLLDRIARIFPSPVIRGVQLAVGLLF